MGANILFCNRVLVVAKQKKAALFKAALKNLGK
jgi:hypothetical protein